MSKSRSQELDLLIEEILTDAYGDDEQRWAFLQAFADNIKTFCVAAIAGHPVRVTKFDYDAASLTDHEFTGGLEVNGSTSLDFLQILAPEQIAHYRSLPVQGWLDPARKDGYTLHLNLRA